MTVAAAEPEEIAIAVVDNHDAVRDAVLALIARTPSYTSVGAFEDAGPALASELVPDVVVLDLYLGRDDQISVPYISSFVTRGSLVVLHTAEERPVPLRAAVAAGVAGVSLKNDGTSALAEVIEGVARGDFVCSSLLASALVDDPDLAPRLTAREVEVLRNLDDGLTQHQVGRRLGITEETVRTHLRTVRAKYVALGRNVTNGASVVREAGRDGWLQ